MSYFGSDSGSNSSMEGGGGPIAISNMARLSMAGYYIPRLRWCMMEGTGGGHTHGQVLTLINDQTNSF